MQVVRGTDYLPLRDFQRWGSFAITGPCQRLKRILEEGPYVELQMLSTIAIVNSSHFFLSSQVMSAGIISKVRIQKPVLL